MDKESLIEALFTAFPEIRYVALYIDDELVYKQKEQATNSSSSESDKYEELLVNPALLKLASQRGNIDCGGLDYLIIRYGNFNQLVKALRNGHISICVEQACDLTSLPDAIFDYVAKNSEV